MAGGDSIVGVEVTADGIRRLGDALKAEADGKELRRELAKNMRTALAPAAVRAKSGIMAMASSGKGTGPGLRAGIAKKIRPEVKLGGMWTGARVKSQKTPNLRGFANAPRRTNRRTGGWRTLTYGHEPWRTQPGRIQWFDRAMAGQDARYRAAVREAMQAMADRIAARTR